MRTLLLLLLIGALASPAVGCALLGSQPPAVTHATGGQYGDCASCHAEGINGAPKTDHPRKADCLSCHPSASGA